MAQMDPRTRALLHAPLTMTLLRLAAPNVLVMLAQSATGLIETYFVGRLGTDALAGMALVFPGVMLMQMMSAGALGGGIASAVARALGSGRRDDANAFVAHALLINVGLGLAFTVLLLGFGPGLYRAMGGEGPALRAALAYSDVVFAAAVLLWVMNALASVVRGTGNMVVPAAVIVGGAVVLIPLSPCLIFGVGPFPPLGVAGGASALVLYYLGGTAVLAWYLWSGRGVLRPVLRGVRLRWALFGDILKVGGVAALITVQTNVTVAVTTGLVGAAGAAAIAGYGTGVRVEYLLIPLVFGFGSPLVAIVGTCIGAGDRARAVRAAWIGAAMAFCMTEAIGLLVAAFPQSWLRLFGSDPAMLAAGRAYFTHVGPFYGLFGIGMAIYFASMGAGKLLWPLLAGLLRMVVAIAGAALMLHATGQLGPMFLALGAGLTAFGLVNAGALFAGVWFPRRAPVLAT